ncbi:alternative oxidase [Leptolyngbya ohadii]|uniref:alternative oxidase n=1 Tax=Leptolyngbya ohadii TaxID=1962290 RepID=UPI000B59D677|nr:alternative oxidase [Leptolyngbya ohadii]
MIRLLVGILVFVINTVYRDRPYPRFYVLETVARVPYFSYLSVLHLYETLGWWRQVDWLKVHFAESWNELHHLLIMEELGGGNFWLDRLLARSVALVYYWIVVALYVVAPRSAYHFMELVEGHAFQTYNKFLKANAAELKAQPAPAIAVKYYRDGDLYMFDEFQSAHAPEERRPQVDNLYDVFLAIRDDEQEHVKTMVACQRSNKAQALSPHAIEKTIEIVTAPADLSSDSQGEAIVEKI